MSVANVHAIDALWKLLE